LIHGKELLPNDLCAKSSFQDCAIGLTQAGKTAADSPCPCDGILREILRERQGRPNTVLMNWDGSLHGEPYKRTNSEADDEGVVLRKEYWRAIGEGTFQDLQEAKPPR
jgi:hypothetical protein